MVASVSFAAKGKRFNRLKSGLRRRYEVEVFGGLGPDALCGACSTTSRRNAPEMLAVLCARGSTALTNKCPVEGCSVGKCPTAQSNLCAKKKEARQDAKGWRSPPPQPRRREGAEAPSPPASPPPEQAATVKEEMEVEEQPPGSQGG